MRRISGRILCSSMMFYVVAAFWCRGAQAQILVHFDLPTQSLAKSLKAIGTATNTDVGFNASQVVGLIAPSLNADLTVDDALARVLAGTGLRSKHLDDHTIVIAAVQSSTTNSAENKPLPAQASTTVGQPGDSVRATNVADSSSQLMLAQADMAFANDATNSDNKDSRDPANSLEEVTVTGSHIRGVDQLAAPVTTISREDILRSGAANLDEYFSNLPQNVNTISPSSQYGAGSSSLAQSNVEAASGISLHGLGPDSTLVLINGKRMAGNIDGRVVDISAIPLSAIERVEIVTGGGSAIYGSDAVAGVVNIITRRSFDGADTQAYYGGAKAGGDLTQFSQVFGKDFGNAGFVAAYDFNRQLPLNIANTDVLRNPGTYGIYLGNADVVPFTERNSGLLSGHFGIGDSLDFYTDNLYTRNRNGYQASYSVPGEYEFAGTNSNISDQYSLTAGLRAKLARSWNMDVSATQGVVDNTEVATSNFSDADNHIVAKMTQLSAIIDGALSLGVVHPSMAFGLERRTEAFDRADVQYATNDVSAARSVNSVFIETQIPLSEPLALRQPLQLSLAGRYDHYSDFGSTANWQSGIAWSPADAVRVRAAYSTAFRAPDLFTLTLSNSANIVLDADPRSPTGTSPVLEWEGGNPGLNAEKAKTWSLGFDIKSKELPVRLSTSYFDIVYQGRIDQPAQGAADNNALQNANLYPGLITRNPSNAQVNTILNSAAAGYGVVNQTTTSFDPQSQSFLAVFPNAVVFDNRQNNVAVEKVRGVDLQASYDLHAAGGTATFGVDSTYYIDFSQQTTALSPSTSELNQPGLPVDLRIRTTVGWTTSIIGASVYVNYVPSYTDTIAVPNLHIASWTTVDLSIRYDASALSDSRWLHGATVSLAISNVFDRAPPVFLSNPLGFGYDPVNANPNGRFVGLRLAKKW
jgi:iron complex outermembrane recepter protein